MARPVVGERADGCGAVDGGDAGRRGFVLVGIVGIAIAGAVIAGDRVNLWGAGLGIAVVAVLLALTTGRD